MTDTTPTIDQSRKRSAFTLIELVMVVLILSIIAAVAVPKYTNVSARYQADAAARRIKADIEYLRHQARRSSSTKSIVFDADDHTYTLPGVADLDHPGQTYEVKLNRLPYKASLLQATCGSDATLFFDGFGQPDSAATIVLATGSEQRTILVEAGMGGVTIQ